MRLLLIFLLISVSVLVDAQERMNLKQAIEVALDNSPDIRNSRYDLERNRELLNAELASRKTQFRFEITPLDFSRNRQYDDFFKWYTTERFNTFGSLLVSQPIVQTDGNLTLTNRLGWQNQLSQNDIQGEVENQAFSNNLFLQLDQPLFTYNRLKMALSEVETAFENSEISYNIQVLNIERQVSQAYFDVLREQESLTIAQDEYQNQLNNFEIVKNKAESGLIAREEMYQAQLNLSNSQSSLQNQEVQVENVKDDFKILLGLDLSSDIILERVIDAEPVEVNLSVAIESGLTSRREIRQREIDMQNAQNNLIRTKATNEFRGDLSLSVGIFGENEALPDIYAAPTNSPRVSLTLAIPIWDWGEKKHRINADMASLQIQELSMFNQRNDIVIAIRRSYRSLMNLKNQITIAEQSVRNAQLTYDINQERYSNGEITGIDLNQYQNQLSQARIDLLAAKINYRLELLNMKIQSMWDFETNSSILPEGINN